MNIKQSPKLKVIIESEKMKDLFSVFMDIYHEYIGMEEVTANGVFINDFNELFSMTTEYLDETRHLINTEHDIYEMCPDFIDYNMFRVFVLSYPVDDLSLRLIDVTDSMLYDKHGTVFLFGDPL